MFYKIVSALFVAAAIFVAGVVSAHHCPFIQRVAGSSVKQGWK